MRVGAAERAAESAESKVERYAKEVDNLQRHVDRLSLACQALWELIQSCSDLTEQDLEKKILEIDGRDGSWTGRLVLRCLIARPADARPARSAAHVSCAAHPSNDHTHSAASLQNPVSKPG
jgi:hypothetical protein